MKVLLINDREEGGGAEIVYQETYKLLQTANGITCVWKSSPYMGIFSSAMAVFGLLNIPYGIVLTWKILSYRPDIVHLHNYSYVVSPIVLLILRFGKRAMGFKIIHTAHDFHLVCPNSGFIRYVADNQFESCCRCVDRNQWTNVIKYNCDRRGIFGSIIRYLRHQVCYGWLHLERVIDWIICPSEFLANQIRQVYPNNNVVVLRNPAFVNLKNKRLLEKKETTTNVLGYFGRLQIEKGIYQFIESDFEASKYSRFLIYGDGPEKHRIRGLIQEMKFEENIQLMGSVSHEEIGIAMNSVDAVVLPSICHENCPLVVCDALKLGKEVLSKSPGGVAELLKEGRGGNAAFLDVETYRKELVSIYRDAVTSGQILDRDHE